MRLKRCPKCHGFGYIYHDGFPATFYRQATPDWREKCSICGGKGKVER